MESEAVLLSPAQAAHEIGVTERRVRQLISEGILVAEKDGMGRDRLTKATVARELARRGRRPTQPTPSEGACTVADVQGLLNLVVANHSEVTSAFERLEATIKVAVEKLSVDRGLLLLLCQQFAQGKL